MSPRGLIVAMGLAGLGLGLAPALIDPPPSLVWNATASAPMGLYRVASLSNPGPGDLVAVRPPGRLAQRLDRIGAAPNGVLLIKHVAAIAPSEICWRGDWLTIDGVKAAPLDTSPRAKPLRRADGCTRLLPQQVLLLNDPVTSLDGRYFGPLERDTIVGRAVPIWTTAGADE